jgi:hypothetical protein
MNKFSKIKQTIICGICKKEYIKQYISQHFRKIHKNSEYCSIVTKGMTMNINYNQKKIFKKNNTFYCYVCNKEIKKHSQYNHVKTYTHKLLMEKYTKATNIDEQKSKKEINVGQKDVFSGSPVNHGNKKSEVSIIYYKENNVFENESKNEDDNQKVGDEFRDNIYEQTSEIIQSIKEIGGKDKDNSLSFSLNKNTEMLGIHLNNENDCSDPEEVTPPNFFETSSYVESESVISLGRQQQKPDNLLFFVDDKQFQNEVEKIINRIEEKKKFKKELIKWRDRERKKKKNN